MTAPPTLIAPLGQDGALARSLRAARRLRLHHALLIAGPPGSGKSTIARWLAAALLCPSELDADGPCGLCRTCRRVASGQFPDLHLLSREEDRREIPVEQVRALQDALQVLPVEGRARVVLIDPADALNHSGQNTLLKTLEEPGADTFLLLVASRPEALLPTVRSRCERLAVRTLSPEVLRGELQRRGVGDASSRERAIAIAEGNLGSALAACTERMVQLHDLVLGVLDGTKPLRILATSRAVASGSNGEERAASVRLFASLLRREAAARLRRALAAAGTGSYVAVASEPWASVVELSLLVERDLDLKIPAEQAVAGLLLEWSRLR